ncbi:MAG: hypothetical protein K2N33_05055 [Clostridia bacterium]|nr:hypothetical protein [Clostridia bacterium]
MKGCPNCYYDFERDCEVCSVTGEPTNGEMKCDFGYEKECPEYKKQKCVKKQKRSR